MEFTNGCLICRGMHCQIGHTLNIFHYQHVHGMYGEMQYHTGRALNVFEARVIDVYNAMKLRQLVEQAMDRTPVLCATKILLFIFHRCQIRGLRSLCS